MTDREYRLQKKRVGGFLTKWQSALGLNWYNIDVIWDRSYHSNPATGATTDMNQWKYRRGTMTFYLPKIAEEVDGEEIERLVIHELCHLLLAPISVNMEELDSDYQIQINEMTTTMTEKAIWWAYHEGLKEGENHGPKHTDASKKSS